MIKRSLIAQPLIEQVRLLLKRLGPLGWKDIFIRQGMDIDAEDLKAVLSKLLTIDRTQPGFEDFALEGNKGIQPSQPAQSLLYHALASSQVTTFVNEKGIETPLQGFPTFEEICLVENLVFGMYPPSIQEIRIKAKNGSLAIVVFASEYRPAITTIHQKHADKCFSRVGISRVGTAPAKYLEMERGFLPFDDNNTNAVRVMPVYYSAYIAIQATGDEKNFGPMHFQTNDEGNDAQRNFWVPVHKLFSGTECLRGMNLQVKLSSYHVNEKIRKIHRALAGLGYDTGWHEPHLSCPPFRFHDKIADLALLTNEGEGFLTPAVHPGLVTKAVYNGKDLTYKTPAGKFPFRSSVIIDSKSNGARSAPEYVHARHELLPDGEVKYLNDAPGVIDAVQKGGYEALHYQDFTGDGCIEVECPELAFYLPQLLPAYSMVAAVDFFPLVKQYDLINWWNQAVPGDFSKTIWPINPGPPLSLCDTRYPANLTLTTTKLDPQNDNAPKIVFDKKDNTISSVVGLFQSCSGALTRIDTPKNFRTSSLPDGAAGVFAPGWDCSVDRLDEATDGENDDGPLKPGITFFNNYGLGSPFPEDSMLCAALSSFWPAAAPDITRSFAPGNYAVTTPLTDEIIGQNEYPSWNKIPAPKIVDKENNVVEFYRLEYCDFVQASLNNDFDFSKITRITTVEYASATLVMARVYGMLGAFTREEKRQWAVFSFTKSQVTDLQRMEAETATNVSLSSSFCYRFELFKFINTEQVHPDFRKKYVRYDKMEVIFADPQIVIQKTDNGWTSYRY